jgi:DNA-binding transcriptional ArsR family regulator
MVEYSLDYDLVFQAMADDTRRDILRRILLGEQRLTDLARQYSMSLAAVAKHLDILTTARLVSKEKRGRERILTADTESIRKTMELLETFRYMD